MSPKLHSAALVTCGTIVGLIVGILGAYSSVEKRIQDEAALRTKTEMRLQSLEIKQNELKSDQWTERTEIRQDIRAILADSAAVKDRVLAIELKTKP